MNTRMSSRRGVSRDVSLLSVVYVCLCWMMILMHQTQPTESSSSSLVATTTSTTTTSSASIFVPKKHTNHHRRFLSFLTIQRGGGGGGGSAAAFLSTATTSTPTKVEDEEEEERIILTTPPPTTPTTIPKTKRGEILPDNFNVRDMYNAYHQIQMDYQQKAFGSEYQHQWNVLHSTTSKHKNHNDNDNDDDDGGGIEVSLLHHPSDPTCPYVRMSATMPVPVQECWDFLRISEWNETMPIMDPFYEGVTVYGEYSSLEDQVDMILCRKRTKRILGTFGKRDFVFLSVAQKNTLQDGLTWVSGTVSVISNTKFPRQPGYTRAFQDSIAFYKPIENHTKTLLTIVCRIDLNDSSENGQGGFIPMWIYVKTIGRTGAMSVHRMRQALIQKQQQKQKQQQQQQEQTIQQNLQ